MAATFRVASLCAGIGGLDLGIGLAAPGARSVVYVERDSFPASVLLARMEAADLEPAPIWCGDLAGVDWRAWRGQVDILAAGFPCQPHSVAGKRKGTEDERWIWRDIVDAIDGCGAPIVFLENVPGLLTSSGGASFGGVLADLAALGFDAEWLVLAARAVGASHKRDRIFILGRRVADTDNAPSERRFSHRTEPQHAGAGIGGANVRRAALADTDGERRQRGRIGGVFDDVGPSLGDDAHRCGAIFPPGPSDLDGWARWLAACPGTEPAIRRGAHGVSGGVDGPVDRIDRLRALGNAVVPLQAGVALRVLAHRLGLDLGV